MRFHPVLCRQKGFHCRLRPLRLLQRRRRLFRQNRTQTPRPGPRRQRHQILFRRLLKHFPRLFRTPCPSRARNVLHSVGSARRRRVVLLRPGRPFGSDCQLRLLPIPVLLRVHQRHWRPGWPDPRSDLLRPGSTPSTSTYHRGHSAGITKAKLHFIAF